MTMGPGPLENRYDRSDVESATKASVADLTSVLAGCLLLVAAIGNFMQGVSAIAGDDLYVATNDYVFQLDTTTWGWVHLVLGVLAGAVAVGILMRAGWGQVTGLIIAGLMILTNFAFLPYYPFWALTLIGFNVLVMWALCTQLKSDGNR
jgi:hypothetical protein